MLGSARIEAMSSSDICEYPSSPTPIPLWVPTIRTFASWYATDRRTVSNRPVTKHENEHAHGTFPSRARPEAIPIMFDSAIPHSMNRSG
jgi:hypothetical protein